MRKEDTTRVAVQVSLRLAEDRLPEYLDDFAALIEDVTGKPVIVNTLNLHISKEATQRLYGKLGLFV